MQRTLVYLAAALGALAFLLMVKLIYDMTIHMGRMTDQVAAMSADLGRMRGQMETLTADVTRMRESVAALSTDVGGIRTGVETMAGVVRTSGEQIKKLNPMEIMQQVLPPGARQ
jgi:uncharacterized protein YoxC